MLIATPEDPELGNTEVLPLRTGIMAGAPCPKELMKQLVRRFHISELTIAHGMTETRPDTFKINTDDPVDKRCGTLGRASPHAEAQVVARRSMVAWE